MFSMKDDPGPGMHGSMFMDDAWTEHRERQRSDGMTEHKVRIDYLFNDEELPPDMKEWLIGNEYPDLLERLKAHLLRQKQDEEEWQFRKECNLQASHAVLTRWAL